MKIAVVFGTRPEAIKVWKLVEELRRGGVEPIIVATGQHQSLLRGTPAENVLAPNIRLGIAGANDPMGYAKICVAGLTREFTKNRPELIVVQGDTASAYAGALVGQKLGIPVAHVEAGVRTGDLQDPWPEEFFRVEIDKIAANRWRFCATAENLRNLGATARRPGEVVLWEGTVTGNTGIDALYSHTKPVSHPYETQDRVLVTLHRRESFGEPLKAIIRGVTQGSAKYPKLEFLWPTHPNPRVREALPIGTRQNLVMMGPMPMITFAQLLAASRAVITDSGGVQEEAAALGVPAIIAREKTDRPESVEIGLAKVAGRTEQGILEGLSWALGFEAKCTPSDCFGDGKAAPRIVQHVLEGKREQSAA